MNKKIRRADVYDAEMITLIGRISYQHAFGKIFNKENLTEYLRKTFDPDEIAVNINRENNAYWIVEMDNRPVGFAKIKKFSLNEEIESGAQMQLEVISVLPEYQNRGAGAALLQQVMTTAVELSPDCIWLDVYTGNKKGIRFYEKNGFQTSGTYYRGFGDQFFEFHMMVMPVNVHETLFCQ